MGRQFPRSLAAHYCYLLPIPLHWLGFSFSFSFLSNNLLLSSSFFVRLPFFLVINKKLLVPLSFPFLSFVEGPTWLGQWESCTSSMRVDAKGTLGRFGRGIRSSLQGKLPKQETHGRPRFQARPSVAPLSLPGFFYRAFNRRPPPTQLQMLSQTPNVLLSYHHFPIVSFRLR